MNGKKEQVLCREPALWLNNGKNLIENKIDKSVLSDIKAEYDDISVLHDVFLALQAHQALFLGGSIGAAGH